MKYIWYIIFLELILINALEYKQFSKMILGDYICFDHVDISLARISLQNMEENFEITEYTKDQKIQSYTFTSNFELLKYGQTTLSLKENGNIHILDKNNNIIQALYKLPEHSNLPDFKPSLFNLLLESEEYQTSIKLHLITFEFNQDFLKRNLESIFRDKEVRKIMMKKIKNDDLRSFRFSSQTEEDRFPTVLRWGCCFLSFGIICLVVNHFFLSQPITDPIVQQNSTDSSFSNKIYVSEDRLDVIHIEPKYLSSSNFSSSSDSKIPIERYEKIMQKHFQSAIVSTEISSDKFKEKESKVSLILQIENKIN